MTDLTEFGFKDDMAILRCRVCGSRIPKYKITTLLGTSVKYGWCRAYTHGISISRVLA